MAVPTAALGAKPNLRGATKVETVTTLRSTNEVLRYGSEQYETFSVSVSALGSGTPSGKVSIKSGSTTLCKISLAGGAGSCSPKATGLKEGTYSVAAIYAGSSQYGASSSAPETILVSSTGTVPRINLCGTLPHSETLSPAAATVYVLTCNVIVPSADKLTLEAGTILKAESASALEVNGSLTSAGTSGSPVTLTSIKDGSVGGETNGEESTPAAGEWRGIIASVGSGAKNGPSVSLEHTNVSYESYVDTSEASSVSLTNSRFLRGPGTCCGYNGVSVNAAGPINVSGDTFVGLAHAVSGYYSYGLTVNQNGSGGSATTTVSGNTLENIDSTALSVSSQGPITVQNNKVSGGTGDAFRLSSKALNPANITGNTSTGDKQNALSVEGTLAASWAMPYSGLAVVISGRLNVPEGITLSMAAGTTLKFEDEGLLEVNGSLTSAGTSGSPVTLTSIKDGSVGGETNGEESTPAAGEWRGIIASVGSGAKNGPSVSLEHTNVSYESYVDTSEASSVSLTNSRFLRGPGTCCGYNGVSVNAAGPINVSGDTFVGLAHAVSGYYSYGLTVNQNGSGGSATTTVSGNTLENIDSTALSVSSQGPITVQNNKVSGGTGDAFRLSSKALNPANITGNTSTGDKQNALSVEGTLAASWAMPYSGLAVVISGRLNVPEGITLSMAAGTTLKFEDEGLLEVNGSLTSAGTSGSPVTLTSIKDGSVGGETNGEESTPAAGEWRGIIASVGSGAKNGPSVSLEHTNVSYESYVDTSEASSVSLTNSRFLRGPGTCCGYNGVSVNAAGPINVSGDTFVGLAHAVSGYYSYGLTVNQNGSGGSATTTVSGNTLENIDSTALSVSSQGPITVQNNKVSGGTGDAFRLSSKALNPANITGNTSTGDKQNALSVEGTLAASWAMPYSGLAVVISGRLNVPEGITLSMAAGTTLKFEDEGLLEVNGSLTSAGTSGSPVTLTSIKDGSVGGETNGEESTPAAGEWRGIIASVGSGAKNGPSVSLEHTNVSYESYVDTSEASSVSLTNSRFLRGPGTCCGYNGVSVNAAGPINVSGDTFVGLAHAVSGYYSYGLTVNQNGSGGSATTTVSGNTLENIDSTALSVSSQGPITVQNNKVSGGTGDAFRLSSKALNPANITGNTSTGDKQNALSVEGTLAASWAMPYSGLAVVISGRLNVPEGITLSMAAGTTLKFEDEGLLEVNGSLTSAGTSGSPVTLTSIKDGSVGGETNGEESTPAAGEWRGIIASVGSGAKNGPSVSLEHTNVSYESYVDTSEASSVSLTNSRFLRGPGTCCGYNGVSVNAAGPINVSGDTFVGLAHAVSGYYSYGLTVNQNGSGGSATTTVSGNTLENIDSTALSVSSQGPITVQNNKVSGGTGDAFRLSSKALNPANITGNTSTGDKQNALSVEGTLAASWAMPYSGLAVVISGRLNVPEGITLSMAAGTTLKFEDEGLLEVNGSLTSAGTSGSPVTLTSIKDGSVGGETNGSTTTASVGEWRGISLENGATATLENTTLQYARTAITVGEGADLLMQKGAVLLSEVGVGGAGYGEAVDVNWGSPSGPAPIGTGTALDDSDVVPAGWLGFVAPPKPKVTPVQPPPAPTCPAVFFVGARGSGEYSNEPEPYGASQQVELLGRKLAWAEKAVETDLAPAKVQAVAVEYPALPFFSKNLGQDVLVLASIVDEEYYDNLWSGAYATEEAFSVEGARCPKAKFVLAGYSSGAFAVHQAMSNVTNGGAQSKVAAVILLADPGKLGGSQEPDIETWGTATTTADGIYTKVYNNWIASLEGDSPSVRLPTAIEKKTLSLCNNHDPVCAPGIGAKPSVHSAYDEAELQSMGDWAAQQDRAGN